ncbi:MAG: hypothetical protein HKP59_01930 [Lutibacter sp.]|uniref:hypothetical protein n=1 Tax=Lutibacter sp. TaxID=1925666 RepID=UPI0017B79725|nr:hypothetical protein [Lutibacter sp.]MBT8316363.1 hypothetical protein [Lutibacter sp.]NNJ57223.1 hypothetical protein [Lutibacter sp.]
MKLTEQQIQQLYKFTRQHYVEHYDVQTELVDHLANDIEQIWTEQPHLSFEQARTISFKKFGVFGFMDVYGARQGALQKKYMKILWQHAKDWFKLPKIIATITLFYFFYLGLIAFGDSFALSVLGVVITFGLVMHIMLLRKVKKRQELNHKKWLLEDIIFRGLFLGGGLLGINLFNIINSSRPDFYNVYWAIFYASIFTIMIVYVYISVIVLPKKAEQLLIENYPEYKLV